MSSSHDIPAEVWWRVHQWLTDVSLNNHARQEFLVRTADIHMPVVLIVVNGDSHEIELLLTPRNWGYARAILDFS